MIIVFTSETLSCALNIPPEPTKKLLILCNPKRKSELVDGKNSDSVLDQGAVSIVLEIKILVRASWAFNDNWILFSLSVLIQIRNYRKIRACGVNEFILSTSTNVQGLI